MQLGVSDAASEGIGKDPQGWEMHSAYSYMGDFITLASDKKTENIKLLC